MAKALRAKVLDFWFKGLLPKDYSIPVDPRPLQALWFGASEKVDQEMRDAFQHDLSRLSDDRALQEEMMQEAEGALAMIIMFDQFPRNIFRNTAQMFAFDEKALHAAHRSIIDLKFDSAANLHPLQRCFFYLPLEHSESLENQRLCVSKSRELRASAAPVHSAFLDSMVRYAEWHFDIIQRFSRFPHRNHVLGRANTPEEEEYLLSQGGSMFGVKVSK